MQNLYKWYHQVDSVLISLSKKQSVQESSQPGVTDSIPEAILKGLRKRKAAKDLQQSHVPSCNHETVGKTRLQKYSRYFILKNDYLFFKITYFK